MQDLDAVVQAVDSCDDSLSSGPPSTSAIPICSPSQQSPTSSGYESGTSSPSHSPPRVDECVLVPEPVQQFNNQQKSFRPILPKQTQLSDVQNDFKEYILSIGPDRKMNEAIFKRSQNIFYNLNSVEKLNSAPLANGDT
jgi:hypothetical protein